MCYNLKSCSFNCNSIFILFYQVIRDNLEGLKDVIVFDPHVQPTFAGLIDFNPCRENNGHCQQFCFAMKDQEKPKCDCAHGSLLSNGSCGYGKDEFLIFATDDSLNSMTLNPEDHSSPFPTIWLGHTVRALEFDHQQKRIFFAQYVGYNQSRIAYITTTSPTSSPEYVVTSKYSFP